MLKVGICDLDEIFINKLLELLQNTLYQYTEWEVEIFNDYDMLMQSIEQHSFDCNLLFVDIFQKADKEKERERFVSYLEENHIDTDVIYITASKDYVFKCYNSRTFAYLLKPLHETDINMEVMRYLKEKQDMPKCLNISIMGQNYRIPLDTILFIESKYRKLIVHTKSRDYEYYDKLDCVEKVLGKDGFVRCHQSYLVPIEKVTGYNRIFLQIDEHAIPISRKYKDTIRKVIKEQEIHDIVINKLSNNNSKSYISSGVFQKNDTRGALICVEGKYLGRIVRFVPEQLIKIGRDNTQSDMIVNLPLVSRMHCTIIYHEKDNNYEICDNSSNGTFADGDIRLLRGNHYLLSPGTTLSFGDKSVVYKLG